LLKILCKTKGVVILSDMIHFCSCHPRPRAWHPAQGGIASSTLKSQVCFFVFSAYGRKSKPPALQVVVDFNHTTSVDDFRMTFDGLAESNSALKAKGM
jgi:hypothetical protein